MGTSLFFWSGRGWSCRAAILTLVVILCACGGGGGEETKTVQPGISGASGKVCITDKNSYSVEIDGGQSLEVQAEPSLLRDTYAGSVGGQIRTVEKFDTTKADEELVEFLVWGLGASIRVGTLEETVGTTTLKRPGAVTGLAQIRLDGEPKLVYSTEGGVGLLSIDWEKKTLVDDAKAFRSVLARIGPLTGVLALDSDIKGETIVFATADGYLQATSAGDLLSGESCADVVTTSAVLKVKDQGYYPIDVRLGKGRAFVLARHPGALTSIAPRYEEAYGPLFQGVVTDVPPAIVRAVDLESHKIFEVGQETADKSFKLYDRFIPTGIDFDDGTLYVVGLAYKQSAVQSFLGGKCSGSGQEAFVKCLLDAAKDTSLVLFEQDGMHPFSGGFFTYRNMDDLSIADHFTAVPVSVFPPGLKAPPFVFRIAVDGGKGGIRGPNFLLPVTRSDTSGGKEHWVLGKEYDAQEGLVAGLPNDILLFKDGTASTFTAVRNADGSGASMIEAADNGGQFMLLDVGAVYVRVEGGGSGPAGTFIADIQMEHPEGGTLYLENDKTSSPIFPEPNLPMYVSRADYDGKTNTLAYVWSTVSSGQATEGTPPLRLSVQTGEKVETRGDLLINRSGVQGIFKNFPEITAATVYPSEKRGIGDLQLINGKPVVVALFTGKEGSKRTLQLALFEYAKAEAKCTKPELRGVMAPLVVSGAHEGKILKVVPTGNDYTVYFSAADGVYSWKVTPKVGVNDVGEAAVRVAGIPAIPLIDAAIDAQGGKRVALVSGFKIDVRDLSNPAKSLVLQIPANDANTLAQATEARAALIGNLLFVATPYGVAKAPLMIFDLSKGGGQAPLSCQTCNFVDVNAFEADPRYLLASSVSSGIEIYQLTK